MKVQAKAVVALALASGASAFAPSAISQSTPLNQLDMAKDFNDQDLVANMGKTAMSFVTASALAFSTATTVLPVAPAVAKQAEPVVVDAKTAKKEAAAAAKAKADAEKQAIAKMGKEEKELYTAKKSLSLSQASLKEYSKFVSDSKSAESKAAKALAEQEKKTATSKAALKSASEKLQLAKKEQMPSSAIKELSEIEGTINSRVTTP